MYENLLQVLFYQVDMTGVWINHKKKIKIKKLVGQS